LSARSGSVVTGGPTKVILMVRVGLLDGLGERVVAGPADGGGEEHQELVVLGDLDGLRSAETWCGGASSRREPSSRPAG
jgi:hypothetical protein